MRFAIAIAALFLAFTAGADATSSEQPAWVSSEATSLAQSCGGMRAEVIARMDYARQIHIDYAGVVSLNPAIGKTVGDVQWHRWWAETYKQTIKLLKQDCS